MNAHHTAFATRPYFLIAIAFLLIEATAVFENVMIFMSIPTLMRELDVGVSTISWAITIFLLVGAATVSLSGRLGDLYGRKRVLVVLLAIAAAGPVISAATASIEGIMIGRALQGTSVALFPLLVAMAREVVPPSRVPVLISITAGAAPLFGSLGTLFAGILLDNAHWTSVFYASGMLAAFALVMCMVVLPHIAPAIRDRTVRTDLVGAVLPMPSIAAALYGVDSIGESSILLNLLFIAGGLGLGAFWIWYELKITNPMFNLRLFKSRSMALVLLATVFLGLGFLAGAALMQPILQQGSMDSPVGLGLSPTAAGVVGLSTGIFGIAFAPWAGKIAARSGAKNSLLIGIAFAMAGTVCVLVGVHNLPIAVLSMMMWGIASTFILSGLSNFVVEVVPAENTGEAVGMVYGTARAMFTAVGTVVASALLTMYVVPGSSSPERTSWNLSGAWLLGTLIAAAVAIYFIRTRIPLADRDHPQRTNTQSDADEARLKSTDIA